jgi:hypothetical protein
MPAPVVAAARAVCDAASPVHVVEAGGAHSSVLEA